MSKSGQRRLPKQLDIFVMRNPELSATYSYVSTCLAKVRDERVRQFFEEVISGGDSSYSKITVTAKSYIDSYDKYADISSEDFMNAMPEPKEKQGRKDFIPLNQTKDYADNTAADAAKMMAAHLAAMVDKS